MVAVLPKSIDDIERDFGLATYLKMQNDPVAGSALDFLIDLVLADGIQVHPRVKLDATRNPGQAEKAAHAAEMKDFIEWCFTNLETPLEVAVQHLCEMVAFGYAVCELLFELAESGPYKGKIVPIDIRAKPRENVRFVVNGANRVLGFLVVKVGDTFQPSDEASPLESPNYLPPAHFIWVSNRMLFGDPRGRSDLRRAYNDWEFKIRSKVEWFKHLMLHGTGKLIALIKVDSLNEAGRLAYETNPDGTIKLNGDQKVQISRVTAIARELAKSMNASVGAIEADELVQVEARSNGEAFVNAERNANINITTAILGASRATQEAEHGSKADSVTALDVIRAKVRRIKQQIALAIDERIVKPLIEINYGRDMFEFRPVINLGTFKFASMLEAAEFAQKVGYKPDESQMPFLDELIGVEVRDMDAIEFRDAQRREDERLAIRQQFPSPGQTDPGPSPQS